MKNKKMEVMVKHFQGCLNNAMFFFWIINLLNMAAGDQKFVKGSGDLFKHKKGKKRNKNPNNNTLKFYMSGYFKNSEKSESKYNYSNIIPNIVLNYVYYKSKDHNVISALSLAVAAGTLYAKSKSKKINLNYKSIKKLSNDIINKTEK